MQLTLLSVEDLTHMIQQLGLIGLDGQHVVALPVDDLFGHAFVAADGIDGDDTAFKGQHAQQFGNDRDLIQATFTVELA